jgi:hypothetical protein
MCALTHIIHLCVHFKCYTICMHTHIHTHTLDAHRHTWVHTHIRTSVVHARTHAYILVIYKFVLCIKNAFVFGKYKWDPIQTFVSVWDPIQWSHIITDPWYSKNHPGSASPIIMQPHCNGCYIIRLHCLFRCKYGYYRKKYGFQVWKIC